ncbi:hypothetical protein CONPUDRAFT_75737 [Coniophora puteana RWD-64-598 SS2]|uniref:Uncharacterized protein n=1 Tax=Coniophora puteana (strain RWD-64-598) TaxID=741705 RepID=A0A5M3MGD4_CONPW|nr:uncharacterized protein CONPUDRAFT_75737 [Coniophora puteana RWD-64-598 SS2]EIW77990.1 hypothetical protein CONPUDRAFT_75737 [Coniophora puteana RWD-64-598 SS2]
MSAPAASKALINEVIGKRTRACANVLCDSAVKGMRLLHHGSPGGVESTALCSQNTTALRIDIGILAMGREMDLGMVYTVARYFPFPALALAIVVLMTLEGAFEAVAFKPGYISTFIHLATILAAEGLLMMRIWAFWDCSRRLLTVLLIIAVIFVGLAIGLTEYVNCILPKLKPPAETSPGTCSFPTGQGSSIQYGFLVVYELNTIVYVFCMIDKLLFSKHLEHHRIPAYHNEYFDSLQLATHSAPSARIFFHIRESAEEIRARALPSHLSTFRVATPVITRNSVRRSDAERMLDDVIVIE